MLLANALADYLAEKTGIARDSFFITTNQSKPLCKTRPVADGALRIAKEYEAGITIAGVVKAKHFTSLQLWLDDWRHENGHDEEVGIETEDHGDNIYCAFIIETVFRELSDLIELTTPEAIAAVPHARQIKYEEKIFKEVLAELPDGI